MKDHSIGAWLQTHGKRNLFEALSEDDCRQMLQHLEARLEQEEQLAAEIHELADRGHQSGCLTPPYGVVAVDAPEEFDVYEDFDAPALSDALEIHAPMADAPTLPVPQRTAQGRQLLIMACALFTICGWSTALYQWGYNHGNQQAQQELAHLKAGTARKSGAQHPPLRPVTPQLSLISQGATAQAAPFRLVEPLRLPTAPTLDALETARQGQALRSPFLGQRRKQLSLQWALHEDRPHAIALRSRLDLVSNGAPATTWDKSDQAQLLLRPQELPNAHNFNLPKISLTRSTQQ